MPRTESLTGWPAGPWIPLVLLALLAADPIAGAAATADEAESLFARASALLETRRPKALLESAELFERVGELQADHALAFSGLATTSCLLALYSIEQPQDVLPRARRAAQTAVRLRPDLAQAYAALGLVAFLYDWDWVLAEAHFRKSIDRDPAYAEVRHWYAMLLTARGRFSESVTSMDEALRLAPKSRIINVKRGTVLTAAGRYREAEAQLRAAIAAFPSMALPWREIGFLELRRGDTEAALVAFEEAAELGGGPSKESAGLGHAYGVAGRHEEAREILDVLLRRSRESFVPPMYVALVYLGLGQRDHALEWLEKALRIHDPGLVYLRIKPGFEALYDDPRFIEILARVGT